MTLAVENLTVRRGEAILVSGVNFRASRGEFIGVIGPNGAGKSTLLRALAGLDRSASGSVTIDGTPIGSMTPAGRARARAYLPQIRETNWAMTAEAVASLGRFAYGAPHRLGAADRAAVEAALAATDSTSFRGRVASTLSGGEEARIHLARALAAQAPVLIADEPTAALDLKHALSIVSTLRAQADGDGLVIAALHDLGLARRHCTRIIVLDQGRIEADGAPEETMSAGLIERVFGVSVSDLGRAPFSPA